MSGRKNYVAWGEGICFDSVNGLFFPAFESVTFDFGLEALTIPDADSLVDDSITIRAPLTGHIIFGKLNSELFAFLTGGSATAGGLQRVRHESKVFGAGGTFSLGATPYSYSELLRCISTGAILKRVSGTPSGNEYGLSGKLVTAATSLASMTIDCNYLKGLTGMKVEIDDNDAPTNFGLVATYRTTDKDATAEVLSDMVIVAPKVRRTSKFSLGAAIRNYQKIEFDFTIEKVPGQKMITVMFPSA